MVSLIVGGRGGENAGRIEIGKVSRENGLVLRLSCTLSLTSPTPPPLAPSLTSTATVQPSQPSS